MPKIALVLAGDCSDFPRDFDLYVAVDAACLFLLKNGISLSWAIGDFDSVSTAELESIKIAAETFTQVPAEKNDTDAELAIKLIFDRYPKAHVRVFGAFGGRVDHMMANLFLPSDPDISPFMRQLCLLDQQNQISYLPAGQHRIFPKKEASYISFMLEGEGELRILGAQYPLTQDNFFQKKIYTSNAFTNKPIEVTVPSGYAIVMRTRDRR